MFYTDHVNQHQPCLFCRYFVYKHDFESPWLWGNSYRVFSHPKQWNGGHVGVPTRPFGSWTHFLNVNTFIGFMKSRPVSETHFFLWFIQQKATLVLVEEKRVHNTPPNYNFLFVVPQKVIHISWRHICNVLNAINTDFKLKINNLWVSAMIHKKLPQHLKVCKIVQHLKESTWTNMESTWSFPEEFFGGPNWCPLIDK